MTKAPKKSSKAHVLLGKGGVRYELPKGLNGPVQIKIDFSQVPPPPSYFYADALSLDVDRNLFMTTLSFGRKGDRIEVVMPQSTLFGAFWQSTRSVEKTVDNVLSQLGAKQFESPIPPGAVNSVTLYANVIHVAVGPAEASLDFYCLSPRDVHLARTQRGDMTLQPIVRVLMATVLMKYFFNILRPLATRFKASNQKERQSDLATA